MPEKLRNLNIDFGEASTAELFYFVSAGI